MRQIRFRAWDTKDKKMVTDGTCDHSEGWDGEGCTYLSIEFDGAISGQINDDGGKNGLHEHYAHISKDRFILMQFTGLKDKNGVDICEGDIIYNGGVTAQVRWDLMACQYDVCWAGGAWSLGAAVRSGGVEVIGNIHANPELLEAKP